MKPLYYAEKDGQIFLVRKNGILSLPEKEDLPFEISDIRKMPTEATIFFCQPKLREFPKEWIHKDSVPLLDNVDKLVHLAVNRSLVRHVSDAIVAKDGKILLVKSSRGFTKGKWDLPGGFITYGESPEESLLREVREETGLTVKIRSLVHTNTTVIGVHYYLALIYLCEVVSGTIKIDPSEISEVAWFPLDEAIEKSKAKFVFITDALKSYKKSLAKK